MNKLYITDSELVDIAHCLDRKVQYLKKELLRDGIDVSIAECIERDSISKYEKILGYVMLKMDK